MPPFLITYSKAESMRPPLQPMLPSLLEQSISCCSEREGRVPEEMKVAPSMEPVVENAQQEPHWPWFLTGVTAPLDTQSTEAAGSTSLRSATFWERAKRLRTPRKPVCLAWNSSKVMSPNSFMPRV